MADWDFSLLGGAAPASKFGGLYGGTASGLDPATFPVPPIPPDIDTSVATPEGWGAGGYNSAPAPGVANKGLADALGTLGGKGAGGAAAGAAAGSKAGGPQLGQAPLGTPRAPVSLNNLVDMLAKRREMYLQAAMSPGGGVPAAQAPSRTGLLGF